MKKQYKKPMMRNIASKYGEPLMAATSQTTIGAGENDKTIGAKGAAIINSDIQFN